MHQIIKVGVDADGGDNGPKVVIEGIEMTMDQLPNVKIVVFSKDDLSELTEEYPGRVNQVMARDIVTMSDSPVTVRSKPSSSIVMACKSQEVDAVLSIGNTGAAMFAASTIIKRIRGVDRAALATVVPGLKHSVLLDVGANVECKPSYFPQFAAMGAAYAEIVLGRKNPTIGLLNIGEEEAKGNEFVKEVYKLMENIPCFVGNVQGGDVPRGATDVTIADGFLGNVELKAMEGSSEAVIEMIRRDTASSLFAKFCYLPVAWRLRRLGKSISRQLYGGAPLLGVRKPFLIGHGSSTSLAVANGIRIAAECVRYDLPRQIEKRLPSS